MRAEPSGTVPLAEAIGRESDVDALWTALGDRSVLLEGRFGMGKTTVARLAVANPPAGWVGCRVALAGCESAVEAMAAIAGAIWAEFGDGRPKLRAAIEPLLDDGVVRAPAATGEQTADTFEPVLRECIDAAQDGGQTRLLIVLDDFDRLCAASGDTLGLEGLCTALANLLDANPGLRLLVVSAVDGRRLPGCAALGLDGDRFTSVSLGVLGADSAARLVSVLLLGESITARDRSALARKIGVAFAGNPRWIHCAMADFAARKRPVLEEDIERCLDEAATCLEREPWALRRELAPLLDGYLEPQRGLGLAILDLFARAEDGALTFQQLVRRLAIEMTIDDDAIQRVVDALTHDQIVESFGGRLRFSGELLRRSWVGLRGL